MAPVLPRRVDNVQPVVLGKRGVAAAVLARGRAGRRYGELAAAESEAGRLEEVAERIGSALGPRRRTASRPPSAGNN